MAEGPGSVAVPGANLLLGGYHAADARGRAAVSDSGQELERHHETHRAGPTCKEHCHWWKI